MTTLFDSPPQLPQLYMGIRGKKFTSFLEELIKCSTLHTKYINGPSGIIKLGLPLFTQAFTHRTINSECNYEHLEFLGDVTLNKSIAWYLSRRYPQLNCPAGVKILTRLKINLISKKSFATIAKRLHFLEFISVDVDLRTKKMDKILEDVFEAFFGALEYIIDIHIGVGLGYITCYSIIDAILSKEHISLEYNDLFDAKTRLKEIFDQYHESLGNCDYKCTKVENLHYVSIFSSVRGFLGKHSAVLKADAQQAASEIAVTNLAKWGFTKNIPPEYTNLII
jgi:dsRNA-specific ribonuclease